jgi:chemotaxis protein MotA
MDLATIIGIVGALVVIVAVLFLDGGSPAELFAAPQAILLTVMGSMMAAVITMPLAGVMKLPMYLKAAFFVQKENPIEAIDTLATMADKARREGLLALEEESKKLHDEFLRKGIQLVVDGIEPAQVRAILSGEIEHMKMRHAEGAGFFAQAGGFAPTFGIIGTVMGLIGVLKSLDDPGKLATSIASAFLATLWGLLISNLIYLPVAAKLTGKSHEEATFREMLMEGVLAIQAGENPRLVREKLYTFLPPKMRPVEGKEKAGGKQEAKA